ncbi:MAG: nucleoside 2-deoxyribosyltransferase [Thermoproteales archaeon]|nr:nucleoside 2-deoxyribosyltransferase [Thermoproteales archaeon]
MKVYLAAPMLGVRRALGLVRRIAAALVEEGHVILTPHVLDDVLDVERGVSPREIYERDVRLMEEADVLVAEVSYPSLGVGFEIAYSLLRGKPVLALCEEGRLERASALIRGITHPGFRLLTYRTPEEAVEKLLRELRRLGENRLRRG